MTQGAIWGLFLKLVSHQDAKEWTVHTWPEPHRKSTTQQHENAGDLWPWTETAGCQKPQTSHKTHEFLVIWPRSCQTYLTACPYPVKGALLTFSKLYMDRKAFRLHLLFPDLALGAACSSSWNKSSRTKWELKDYVLSADTAPRCQIPDQFPQDRNTVNG